MLATFLAFSATAAELQVETLAAWDRYIEAVDARLRTASPDGLSFLQVDTDPDQLQRLKRGDTTVWQVKDPNAQAISGGLIHHWAGAVFVPNATVADAEAAARDYGQYPNWFGPTVDRATLFNQSGDEDRFSLVYVRKVLFVTGVLETESVIRFIRVSPTRLYSVTRTSRIHEIREYGQPNERKTLSEDGNGYLWRAYSVSRYEQRDSGVYVEQITIGLSRDIPRAVRWLVEPAVSRLSRDLMEKSLLHTREAILSKSAKR